jgi:hypothetical protein
MSTEKASIGSTLVSSLAFLAIAAALGGLTVWLAWLIWHVADDISQVAPRLSGRASRATAGMVLGLIAAAIGTIFFAAVGIYTLWLGLTDFRKKPTAEADDRWKNMPYPKG